MSLQPQRAARPAGRRKPTKRMSEQITNITQPIETPEQPASTPAPVEDAPEEPVVSPAKPPRGVQLFGGIDPSAVKLRSTKPAAGTPATVAAATEKAPAAPPRPLPRPGTPTLPHAAHTEVAKPQTSPVKAELSSTEEVLVSRAVAALLASATALKTEALASLARSVAEQFQISIQARVLSPKFPL